MCYAIGLGLQDTSHFSGIDTKRDRSMKVLGIYGSPRKGGNSDQLLDKALKGAHSCGAETRSVYPRDLNMCGCLECGGCDKTGRCVVKDDMQSIYPLLQEADVVILASPIFFYNVTAQAKALIDRSQAMWSKRMLEKDRDQRKRYDSGKGYLIAVAASKGQRLFDCAGLTARYFFDAMDMSYEGGLFFRGLESKTDLKKRPDMLEQAFKLGRNAVQRGEKNP
jgi:multimeric flavodoxin WrbA